jgi:hypothetical protein
MRNAHGEVRDPSAPDCGSRGPGRLDPKCDPAGELEFGDGNSTSLTIPLT